MQRIIAPCIAGGGGKTLAVAGRAAGNFFAHDADQKRMKNLPARAARAGVKVKTLSLRDVEQQAPFDTILIDTPCSGSGSWRRDPQGKWLLTHEKLRQLLDIQREILDQSAQFVRSQGHLTYSTCSLLNLENSHQIDAFLSCHSEFSLTAQNGSHLWMVETAFTVPFSAEIDKLPIGQNSW